MIENRQVMAKNIKKYMDIKNITVKEICEELGFKKSTFYDWLNGNAYPRIDKIEIMANYFGISKANLVEENFWDYIGIPDPKAHKSNDNTSYEILQHTYAPGLNDKALKLYEKYINAEPHIRDAIDKLLGMESE